MNAPPNIDPVNVHSDSDVVHWLTNDTCDQRFIDNIFAELCVRLQQGVRWNLKSSTSTYPKSSTLAHGLADRLMRTDERK